MQLFIASFAFLLTEIFALPTGWSAGPSTDFGQPGDAKFDYVRSYALVKKLLVNFQRIGYCWRRHRRLDCCLTPCRESAAQYCCR